MAYDTATTEQERNHLWGRRRHRRWVARTFAQEGAILTGRTRKSLDAVASDIASAGGIAEVTEVGPHGVRVVGLYTAGVPETFSREKFAAVNNGMDVDPAQIEQAISSMTMLRRAPRLPQVADAAAFLASDRAAAITGTFLNVTGGLLPG